MSSEPLAHSARDGIPAQSYRDHVSGVLTRSRENAAGLGESHQDVAKTVEIAASLHDLGKLDPDNQIVLSGGNPRKKLPMNHCDGGTSHLWREGHIDAAGLVYSHHLGLFSYPEEVKKGDRLVLRDSRTVERTDKNVEAYLSEHRQLIDVQCARMEKKPSSWSGLTRRMALSCLVDADWGNTAQHFGKERRLEPARLRWKERLQSLDTYVASLPKQADTKERDELRQKLYLACKNADTKQGMRVCEAPVGTGKTTAIMAHLLRVAEERHLRRIFVVLPYTNIIRQAVNTYRAALTLDGERPEDVVAEHHHQADFSEFNLREMAELWEAPIVVTTAVQFFETLGNHLPARLRKLHQVPRSAIFVDEAHAAIPASLWPQHWFWFQELVKSWGCHIILASGSLVRFWENAEFLRTEKPERLDSIVPVDLVDELMAQERTRVSFPVRQRPMNRHELRDFILEKPGPRLVIMNTVQSAAVMAHEIHQKGKHVIHLSTALAPIHRDRVVERIKDRLKYGVPDWTLVATSCVEAGMDFDFRSAFRESASVCSLLQTAGRVNRHGRHTESDVFDFRTSDKLLNAHPSFDRARHVLDQMYDQNLLSDMPPDKAASVAFEREIETGVAGSKADLLLKAERDMDYPEVGKLNRVIDADTRLVVVAPDMVEAIRTRRAVTSRDLIRNSIQLWSQKVDHLALEPLGHHGEMFSLGSYRYDPEFLGYMEGLLPLVYAEETGLIV